VRRLLAARGPFDPEQLPGLERHQAFLTESEVVFLFETEQRPEALASLLDAWKGAAAWRDHLDGSPRIAEEVYSWVGGAESEELSFLPTPGPGDSEGGDVF
jgi:hypothetical protein